MRCPGAPGLPTLRQGCMDVLSVQALQHTLESTPVDLSVPIANKLTPHTVSLWPTLDNKLFAAHTRVKLVTLET